MSDLIVVYDPAKEIAAIVDLDERIGFGPAMIGEHAGSILEAFLQSIPYDVTETGSYTLRGWFEQFAEQYLRQPQPQAAEADPGAVVDSPSTGVDNAALAEHEASASAGEPPEPAPHDTDMEADTGEADTVKPTDAELRQALEHQPPPVRPVEQQCFACDGTGRVPGAEPDSTAVCNLCHGTGRIMAEAPA